MSVSNTTKRVKEIRRKTGLNDPASSPGQALGTTAEAGI